MIYRLDLQEGKRLAIEVVEAQVGLNTVPPLEQLEFQDQFFRDGVVFDQALEAI